jgi:hypothetical protein
MAKVRGRGKVGDVVKIDLGNGTFGYGRILPKGLMAFYGLQSTEPMDASEVIKSDVLFTVGVMYRAIKSEHWDIIGNIALEESLKKEPNFFVYDLISKELFIYHPDGRMTPATHEECIGLEWASGWDDFHIEDRLRDHFDGKPNKWVEDAKLPEKWMIKTRDGVSIH